MYTYNCIKGVIIVRTNTKINIKTMKKILIVALAVMAIGAVSAQNINTDPYIEVRGVAKEQVTPNKAIIEIELNQADSKGKVSMADLEAQLAAAMQLAGVDVQKQLVLTDQSTQAQKSNKSYQFKSYQLTVSSATEANQVFDALKASGVQNAQLTRIWNDDIKKIETALKVKAVDNAKLEAQQLAAALNQTIGKAIVVTSFGYTNDGIYMPRMYSKSSINETMDVTPSLPAVDFRPMNVEQSVTIRFELK